MASRPSTIFRTYPSTIFRSYGAGGVNKGAKTQRFWQDQQDLQDYFILNNLFILSKMLTVNWHTSWVYGVKTWNPSSSTILASFTSEQTKIVSPSQYVLKKPNCKLSKVLSAWVSALRRNRFRASSITNDDTHVKSQNLTQRRRARKVKLLILKDIFLAFLASLREKIVFTSSSMMRI